MIEYLQLTTRCPNSLRDLEETDLDDFRGHVGTIIVHLKNLEKKSKAYTGYLADIVRGMSVQTEKPEITRLPGEIEVGWNAVMEYLDLLKSVLMHKKDGICIK